MMEDATLGIGIMLVMYAIIVPISALINALVLRWAARKAVGLELPYGVAFVTTLLGCGAGLLLNLPLTIGFSALHVDQSVRAIVSLALLPASYLLQGAVISYRHGLTFAQAMKVVGYMILLGLAIGLIVGLGVVVLGVGLAALVSVRR